MSSFSNSTLEQMRGKSPDLKAVSEALDLHGEANSPLPFIHDRPSRRPFPNQASLFFWNLYHSHPDIHERARALIDDRDYWIREACHYNTLWEEIETWNYRRGKVNMPSGGYFPEQLDAPTMDVLENLFYKAKERLKRWDEQCQLRLKQKAALEAEEDKEMKEQVRRRKRAKVAAARHPVASRTRSKSGSGSDTSARGPSNSSPARKPGRTFTSKVFKAPPQKRIAR